MHISFLLFVEVDHKQMTRQTTTIIRFQRFTSTFITILWYHEIVPIDRCFTCYHGITTITKSKTTSSYTIHVEPRVAELTRYFVYTVVKYLIYIISALYIYIHLSFRHIDEHSFSYKLFLTVRKTTTDIKGSQKDNNVIIELCNPPKKDTYWETLRYSKLLRHIHLS